MAVQSFITMLCTVLKADIENHQISSNFIDCFRWVDFTKYCVPWLVYLIQYYRPWIMILGHCSGGGGMYLFSRSPSSEVASFDGWPSSNALKTSGTYAYFELLLGSINFKHHQWPGDYMKWQRRTESSLKISIKKVQNEIFWFFEVLSRDWMLRGLRKNILSQRKYVLDLFQKLIRPKLSTSQ